MIRGIFPRKRWGGSWRGKAVKPPEGLSLYLDPVRATEPIDIDSQFLQRLLKNPAVTIRPEDPDRPVRNATGKLRQ